jgi:hypothetical protein
MGTEVEGSEVYKKRRFCAIIGLDSAGLSWGREISMFHFMLPMPAAQLLSSISTSMGWILKSGHSFGFVYLVFPLSINLTVNF